MDALERRYQTLEQYTRLSGKVKLRGPPCAQAGSCVWYPALKTQAGSKRQPGNLPCETLGCTVALGQPCVLCGRCMTNDTKESSYHVQPDVM